MDTRPPCHFCIPTNSAVLGSPPIDENTSLFGSMEVAFIPFTWAIKQIHIATQRGPPIVVRTVCGMGNGRKRQIHPTRDCVLMNEAVGR